MKILKNSNSVALQFRVNSTPGTDGDEAEMYLDCVNTLAREMVFFSVERFGYISEESDDCIMGVVLTSEMYDILLKVLKSA